MKKVDWINYETRYLTKNQLVESIFKATGIWIQLFEKYGIFNEARAYSERIGRDKDYLARNLVVTIYHVLNHHHEYRGLRPEFYTNKIGSPAKAFSSLLSSFQPNRKASEKRPLKMERLPIPLMVVSGNNFVRLVREKETIPTRIALIALCD